MRRFAKAAAAAAISLASSRALGAQFDWTDPTSGNWSNPDFWNPSAPPSGGSATTDLVFYTNPAAPSSYIANNDLGNPFNLHSLVFRNFADQDITLTGSPLRFTGTAPFIRMEWSGENAVLNPIQLAATTTFSSTFAGVMLLGGAISGTGGLNLTAGTLHLSGVNTYSGDTTITDSTLVAAATNTLSPNSTIVMGSGANLSLEVVNPIAINSTTIPAGVYSQNIGGLSGGGFIELQGASLTLGGNNASTTFDGQIGGLPASSITKVGTGTFTVTSEISVPQININAGAISVQTGIGLGGATVNLNVNNGLDLNNLASVTIGGLTGSGNLNLGSTILTLVVPETQTYSGVLSGSGSLIKSGGALLELSGNNTFIGGTTVTGGVLHITKDAALGAATAPLTLASGGTLELGASFNLAPTRPMTVIAFGAIDTGAFNTAISQSIGEEDFVSKLAKFGSGALTLSGSNTYTGGTALTQGTLVLANANAAGTGEITVNDGLTGSENTALLLGQGISMARNVHVQTSAGVTTIGSLAASANASTFAGDITLDRSVNVVSGSGGITRFDGAISGAGAGVNIVGNQLVQFRGAAKTYSGQTDITSSNGVLSIAAAGASPVNSTVRVQSGAMLVFEGVSNATIGGLTGTGNVTTNAAIGPSSVRIGNNNASTSFSGTITGAMAIEKIGTGTLVLAGTNDYAGPTTFTAGTLQAGASANLGSETGALILNGGTLKTTDTFATPRPLTVNAPGGAIDATGQTLSITGPTGVGGLLTLAGGTLNLPNADGAGSTTVSAGATLIADRIRQTNLNIDGAARIRTNGSQGATTVVKSLSIATSGLLDLNNNDLIVNYDGASPFAALEAEVFRGFDNVPNPSRRGIVSGTSQNDPNSPLLVLFDNALVNLSSFNNITIDATTVVGKYTYWGDVNLDGQVTQPDFDIIASHLGMTGVDPRNGWLLGDMNFDGLVTGDDFTALDANVFTGVSNPLSPSSLGDASLSAVPEPGTAMALVGLTAGIVLRRRRRS